MKTRDEVRQSAFSCIVGGHHGVYVPQVFCLGMTEEDAKRIGVSWEDIQTCQNGPDAEDYWEAWDGILSDCVIVADGCTITLHQDGDLFEVNQTIIKAWEDESGESFWDQMP